MKNIINKYKSTIQIIIKKITGKPNEDLEQEVYLKTWKNLDRYKESGKIRQWISTITSNLCKDYLKSAHNRKEKVNLSEEQSNNIVCTQENIEEHLERKLRRQKVSKAILSLPTKLQEVIVLYELEGLDYREISEQIKCPIGTVKSRLYKARQELYRKLQDIL